MSDDGANESEKVGYGRPPIGTRFKPGQSGNPKGRPKEAKNLRTIITEELKNKVFVTENGNRKAISKGHAIGKQVVNHAVSGDVKATNFVFNATREQETAPINELGSRALHRSADRFVQEGILDRLRAFDIARRLAEAAPSEPSPEPQVSNTGSDKATDPDGSAADA